MIALAPGPLVVALVITVLEMTEVVALVFALGAAEGTVRHGALGATAGVAVVGGLALGAGAAILRFPHVALLWASAVLLSAFTVFLFRSTLRAFRRQRAAERGGAVPAPRPFVALQFAGGFAVGAVEATEAVVVLLAIAAAGAGSSAIVGAVVGGAALALAALAVRERIRRIKTTRLRAFATSLVLTFALYWAGEALGIHWPGDELVLFPLFGLAAGSVMGLIALFLLHDERARVSPGAPSSPAQTGPR